MSSPSHTFQCRLCQRPVKVKCRRLCGAHDKQRRTAGMETEAFVQAVQNGEQPGRKKQQCRHCGKTYRGGHRVTCSAECDREHKRKRSRDHNRQAYQANPQKYLRRAQRYRRENPERYRAYDQRRLAQQQAKHRRYCQECGTETTGTRPGRKYCCVACRDMAYSRQRRLPNHTDTESALASIALARPNAIPRSPGGRRAIYQHRCEQCHEEFRSVTGRARFCCKACGETHRRISRSDHQRRTHSFTCTHCHEQFASTHPNSRYCSPECRKAVHAARKRTRNRRREERAAIQKVCDECGRTFSADRKNAVCCSVACRKSRKRRQSRQLAQDPHYRQRQLQHYRARRSVSYECSVCGTDMSHFSDLRVNRYTCSEACRREARRRRNRRSYLNRTRKGQTHD